MKNKEIGYRGIPTQTFTWTRVIYGKHFKFKMVIYPRSVFYYVVHETWEGLDCIEIPYKEMTFKKEA